MIISIKQFEQLKELLNVKPSHVDSKQIATYDTSWGTKTEEGLRLSIEKILSE